MFPTSKDSRPLPRKEGKDLANGAVYASKPTNVEKQRETLYTVAERSLYSTRTYRETVLRQSNAIALMQEKLKKNNNKTFALSYINSEKYTTKLAMS